MPVDPVEFNQLKLDVEALQTQVDALEDQLDESETGSILDRLAQIEASMVSINQTVATKKSLEADISGHGTRLQELELEMVAFRNLLNALQRWRTDLRHEVYFSTATNLGGGTSWQVPNAYDETSVIMVFQSNLTLVDPALITLSEPSAGKFTSAVALTPGVRVFYFVKLPVA